MKIPDDLHKYFMRFREKVQDYRLKQLKESLLANLPKGIRKMIVVLTHKLQSFSKIGDGEAAESMWCDIIRSTNGSNSADRIAVQLIFHIAKYETNSVFPHCGIMACLKMAKEIEDAHIKALLLDFLRDFAEIADEHEWLELLNQKSIRE